MTRTAEMAEATIRTTARSESRMIFLLLVVEDLGSLTRVMSEREESEGPSLPYPIVKRVCV